MNDLNFYHLFISVLYGCGENVQTKSTNIGW